LKPGYVENKDVGVSDVVSGVNFVKTECRWEGGVDLD
jgi:hypothetical protein